MYTYLPVDGTAIGNASARQNLGWNKTRYVRAKDGLLEKTMITRARGRGGAIRRIADGPDNASHAGSVRMPVPELDLYAPILQTLGGEWADERNFRALAIEQTAFGGRRRTGGTWTRPDLVAVGIKSFTYVPTNELEVITFEVKPMRQLNVVAVYEALAHRRSSTHAYVVVEVLDELARAHAAKLEAVAAAADDHGVGVITFSDPADFETWDEVIAARRSESRPELVDQFIEAQVSTEGKQKIRRFVCASRGSDYWLFRIDGA